MYNEEGEINVSRGTDTEDIAQEGKYGVYVLACGGAVLITILLIIFYYYKFN